MSTEWDHLTQYPSLLTHHSATRNSVAIQPIVPPASRTLRQVLPSEGTSGPTTSTIAPSSMSFSAAPPALGRSRRFTPPPSVLAMRFLPPITPGAGGPAVGFGAGVDCGAAVAGAGAAVAAEGDCCGCVAGGCCAGVAAAG